MTVTRALQGFFSRHVLCAGARVPCGAPMIPLFAAICRSSAAIRAPASGSRNDSVPTRDQVCARVEQVARVTPGLHAAHADDRDADALADLAHLRQRDRADRRAGHAAGAAAEPRLARPPRVHRHPAQRVDRARRRRRRAASAAAATAAGDAQFGVSLTISGLAVRGRTASSSAARLARVGAHQQPGLDVRAGDVELERGDLVALGERRDERRDLLGGWSPSR